MQQQRRRATTKNRILADLSAADKALLQSDLEPVTFTLRQVLEAPNKPIQHSYFIDYGLVSIVAANNRKRLEVGLIGCEGVPIWERVGLMRRLQIKALKRTAAKLLRVGYAGVSQGHQRSSVVPIALGIVSLENHPNVSQC